MRGRSIDGAIRRVVRRHPAVVKSLAWGPQWAPLYQGDPAVVLAGDRFHASSEGHVVFAASAAPVMDELLARLASSRSLPMSSPAP